MKLLFTLILLVSSQNSLANPPKWSDFFDGNDNELFVDLTGNKELPFLNWVKGYKSCSPQAGQLITELEKYDDNFRSNKSQLAEKNYFKIQSLLKSNPQCFETLWTIYLVKSLMIGPKVIPSEYKYTHKGAKSLFTLLLSNKKHIVPLTPKIRKRLAKENAAPLWVEKKEGAYIITAFYDCLNSKIYIGSKLRPFNIAASLSHELDHLYRDKVGYINFLEGPKVVDRSMLAYIAADELLATIYGGFYQRHMIRIDVNNPNNYSHYGGEFNFFSIDGPLDRFFGFFPKTNSRPWPFYEFIYGYVHGGLNGNIIGIDAKDVRKIICEMNEIIINGYFEKTNSQKCDPEKAFPNAASFTLENRLSHHTRLREQKNKPDLYKEYQGWLGAMTRPSRICNLIIAAEKKGEFEGYIGTKLMSGGHGGNGGIRPCLKVNF